MIVTRNNDTCAIITAEQYKKLNRMYVENNMFNELCDSLIANDLLRVEKEKRYIQTIAIRDLRLGNYEKIIRNNVEVISLYDQDKKKSQRKLKTFKTIAIIEFGIIVIFISSILL